MSRARSILDIAALCVRRVADPMSNPNITNWITIVALGAIWGASFLGVEIALQGYGPVTIAAFRILIGAAALLALSFAIGEGLPPLSTPRVWLHVIGFAIFTNALPFTLLSWGQQSVTSGFAGIAMAVVPLIALPLAHLCVPGEAMNTRKVIGFVLGFIGVLILIGLDAFSSSGAEQELLARLACAGAAACYAIGSIITRLCPPVPLLAYSAAGLLIGSLLIVPLALAQEGLPELAGPAPTASVIYLGLLPTAFATVLLVRVINSAGPTFMSMVNYMIPIWAIIFGAVLLREEVPQQFLQALCLILLGLAVAQAPLRRFRP